MKLVRRRVWAGRKCPVELPSVTMLGRTLANFRSVETVRSKMFLPRTSTSTLERARIWAARLEEEKVSSSEDATVITAPIRTIPLSVFDRARQHFFFQSKNVSTEGC